MGDQMPQERHYIEKGWRGGGLRGAACREPGRTGAPPDGSHGTWLGPGEGACHRGLRRTWLALETRGHPEIAQQGVFSDLPASLDGPQAREDGDAV